ncbi:HNH endonuclease [Sulfurimonas sp. HSL1-6]|uniref:HNH endonuclease n=1 Tax=Thiomicrolovo immobilis TaxID=3131935 RepID=UPI0031F75BEE
MTKAQKYLEALKTFDDWVIVSEWAVRVGELYPDLLEEADRQAENQKIDTTGLRELAARISSRLSTGGFDNDVEIDDSERPRKVRYATEVEKKAREEQELEEDIEPLTRAERIRKDSESLTVNEEYRIGEFETISKQLNRFFGLDFEVDHAAALLNPSEPGKHHPDNLQLLIKAHNGKKNKSNWQRFSFEEQKDYIETVIRLQQVVAPRLGIEMEVNVLESLLDRLQKVYE